MSGIESNSNLNSSSEQVSKKIAIADKLKFFEQASSPQPKTPVASKPPQRKLGRSSSISDKVKLYNFYWFTFLISRIRFDQKVAEIQASASPTVIRSANAAEKRKRLFELNYIWI